MSSYQRHLPQSAETILAAVSAAAEMWGADWRPGTLEGRLRLPVVQGLRHGVVEGPLTIEPQESGTSLTFEIEGGKYSLNKSAIAILILGALGGLTLVLWPISPAILQLAPIGAVLALVAWLMVVSRLRNSDPEDFVDLVADLAAHNE